MTSFSAKIPEIVLRTARKMLDARNSSELEAIKAEVGLEVARQAWYQLGDGEKAIVESTAELSPSAANATTRDKARHIACRMLNAASSVELKAIKTEVGAELANKAWRCMGSQERAKIKAISRTEQALLFPVKAEPLVEPESLAESEDYPDWEVRPVRPRTFLELGPELEEIDAAIDTWEETELPDDRGPLLVLRNWLDRQAETDEAYRDKLDRYAALIRNRELMAEARVAEARRLQELAEADLALVERLKQQLQVHLKDLGSGME